MGLFGGGNSSSTSNTTNQAFDQRQVTDASNGGVVGSGNTFDSSSTLNTSNSGNTNTWANAGNTSTFTTSNSGNTTTNVQALDGGAIGGAFGFAGDAFKQLTGSISDALDFANASQRNSYAASSGALDKAAAAFGDALSFGQKQTASALSSLQTSANVLDRAYADAKGRGAMTDYLMLAALAAVALVAWKAAR